MKNLFFFLLSIASFQTAHSQAEWAPVGSKWWVQVHIGFFEQKRINTYECTSSLDTLGQTCKVIHERVFDGVETDYFFYQDVAKVFVWDSYQENFVLLYDYSKLAGESYEIIYPQDTVTFFVDSVTLENFAGDNIKVQHGKAVNPNAPFSDQDNLIYEGIGTAWGLWPELPSNLITETWYYLACFLKPNGTLYEMNPGLQVDCPSLATATFDKNNRAGLFTLAPNPSVGPITLFFSPQTSTAASLQILNSYGQKIQEHQLPSNGESIQIDGLETGLYFATLFYNGRPIKTKKLLRF